MWHKLSGVLVWGLFLAALALAHTVRRSPDASDGDRTTETALDVTVAARIFPDAASTRLARDGGWTAVLGPDGRRLGVVVSTSPQMDGILGHNGPVPVLIGVDSAGTIVNIVLLDNRETPGFVQYVERSGFLDQWTGRSIAQAEALEVDAVSSATMTSSAIARSIRGRLAQLEGVPMDDVDARPGTGFFSISFSGLDAAIALLILAAVLSSIRVGFLKHPRAFRVARMLVLAASIALLGITGATMVSMALIEGWAVAGRVHGGVGLVLLVLAAVAFPLLSGRNIYCQRLCPFGASQELLWKLSKRKRQLPRSISKHLRKFRYGLLIAVVLSIIAGRGLTPDLQEPFSAFRWQAAGWPALVIAGVALLVSAAGVHRPWCSYCCSSGALLNSIRTHRKQ